ncbi:MAG: pilus assembly protein PilM [Planctomycetota bacterium]
MFSSNAVAVDFGATMARAIWIKGAPGSIEVVKAILGERDDPVGVVGRWRAERMPVGGIALGVTGSSATLRYNVLPPVPDWRLALILKYETEEMAEKSGEALSSDSLLLEIPESPTDDLILLVGMGKELLVQPRIEQLEAAGARVRMAIPHAVALFHAYRHSLKGVPRETVLLADVGARETQIVLAAEGRLLFARSVNFGGDQMDEILARRLDVRPDAARKLKEELHGGRIPEPVIENARSALRSSHGQLLQILQSSITFCRAQTRIPEITLDRVLVSGGGVLLPEVPRFLEDGFQVPVEVFRPKLAGVDLPGDPTRWVTALGLAAAQLDPERRILDLLPSPAKARRRFRERTVFLWGSAAALLLALLLQLIGAFAAHQRVSAVEDDLREWEAKVTDWKQEERRARAENQKYRNQAARLRREVLVSRFTWEILETLRKRIPEPLSIGRVWVDRQEVEGKLYFSVHLEGKADNSDRRGIDHVQDLKGILGQIPGASRVEISVGDLEEGFFPYRLAVSPDREPPPEPSKSPRRGGGRRRRTER